MQTSVTQSVLTPFQAEQEAAALELNIKREKARNAFKYFMRVQESEAKRLGFASYTNFARYIITEGGRAPAKSVDINELEIVAAWFHRLTEVNQWIMVFQFDTIHGGVPWKRARDKYKSWNRDKFNNRIDSLLRDLGGAL